MSRDGQAARRRTTPAALAADLAPRAGFESHVHEHHQLALAARGVLVMALEGTTWVLPRSRALWVPAGVHHSVTAEVHTRMLSLYFDPPRCPLAWSGPTAVAADGLLGELVVHLCRDDLPADERARAEAVLWDQMAPLPVTTLATPPPADERGRRVADGLLADPTDKRTLHDWGRVVGASARTLARLFAAETGMGFERWRTNVRLAAALPRLADGASVGAVARQVGYATPSAFVAAFRREIGTTPAEYFRTG